MMAVRLHSSLDLARQNIPKLLGLHFCAQAQVMFAQGQLGVTQVGADGIVICLADSPKLKNDPFTRTDRLRN